MCRGVIFCLSRLFHSSNATENFDSLTSILRSAWSHYSPLLHLKIELTIDPEIPNPYSDTDGEPRDEGVGVEYFDEKGQKSDNEQKVGDSDKDEIDIAAELAPSGAFEDPFSAYKIMNGGRADEGDDCSENVIHLENVGQKPEDKEVGDECTTGDNDESNKVLYLLIQRQPRDANPEYSFHCRKHAE